MRWGWVTAALLSSFVLLGCDPKNVGKKTMSCQTDAACDDDNPCTDDQCVKGSGEDKGVCANTDPCATDGMSCRDGECVPACERDSECDDGEGCTVDVCEDPDPDEASGKVCTNRPVECEDGEFCDPYSGECVMTCSQDPDCDDDVFCNGEEVCDDEGVCQTGDNPCPGLMCLEAEKLCEGEPSGILVSVSPETGTFGDEVEISTQGFEADGPVPDVVFQSVDDPDTYDSAELLGAPADLSRVRVRVPEVVEEGRSWEVFFDFDQNPDNVVRSTNALPFSRLALLIQSLRYTPASDGPGDITFEFVGDAQLASASGWPVNASVLVNGNADGSASYREMDVTPKGDGWEAVLPMATECTVDAADVDIVEDSPHVLVIADQTGLMDTAPFRCR